MPSAVRDVRLFLGETHKNAYTTRRQSSLYGHYAVRVDENRRLTFKFDSEHAELVDYQDYR